jgi:hypothetical protein
MIVVVYQDGCKLVADTVASQLLSSFADKIEVLLLRAESDNTWPAAPTWDDLLIVIFNKEDFPPQGIRLIEHYLQKRPDSAQLLPVATDTSMRTPPGMAGSIKALQYDASTPNPTERLVTRVGGMLGLRLQGRDSKMFISYRAKDGASIARQIYDYLITLGHRPFLDEAKEVDGETKILPGSQFNRR